MSNPVATYNYGETPEEVIRDAFYGGGVFDKPRAECIDGLNWRWRGFSCDELLTVLDALRCVGNEEIPGNPLQLEIASRNLRIAILAALGIEEG